MPQSLSTIIRVEFVLPITKFIGVKIVWPAALLVKCLDSVFDALFITLVYIPVIGLCMARFACTELTLQQPSSTEFTSFSVYSMVSLSTGVRRRDLKFSKILDRTSHAGAVSCPRQW